MNNHEITDLAALKRWMTDDGRVDYDGLKNDPWLTNQLEKLVNTNLKELSHQEEFAFWLNSYNLLTLKGVLIELEKNPSWKGNLSLFSKIKFFYLRKFKVANRKMSLYNLENKILRRNFKDPRIHFAINCGSISCPYLPNRLFDAEGLDEFLHSLTRYFINMEEQVFYNEEEDKLYLNPIFKWYRKDFKQDGGVVEFIKKYWNGPIEKLNRSKIAYLPYNWKLNAQ
ncbi:MAG: DUF547 domain-containing protein [Candidatus Kariarchaeaceae archaeon]